MLKYFTSLLLFVVLYSQENFELYKMNTNQEQFDTTVLIIGGIHGNEPGAYFAPSIFFKHYKITKNQIWIIPALNKKSIQKNARGVYGDMNRKFKHIKKSDPDYNKVQKLKKIILDDRVSMVLNLHDGHGFFRPSYENIKKNQYAWGQTAVIDQEKLDVEKRFSHLYEIATKVRDNINSKIDTSTHLFRVKNTHTKTIDIEQQNSLTFFAIQNNKPAFAIETSKEIKDLSIKVLYQLQAIEGFLKIAGVEFERDFNLNIHEIKRLINDYGTIKINDNISFNLSNIRPYIGFFPLKKKNNTFEFSDPIGSYSYSRNLYHLHIGNKHIASLKPDYFKSTPASKNITMQIDGLNKQVQLGQSIKVKNYFMVKAPKNIRVNVIGYGDRNDNFKKIYKEYIPTKYSLDLSKHLFRIEFYKRSSFLGMIVVDFNQEQN